MQTASRTPSVAAGSRAPSVSRGRTGANTTGGGAPSTPTGRRRRPTGDDDDEDDPLAQQRRDQAQQQRPEQQNGASPGPSDAQSRQQGASPAGAVAAPGDQSKAAAQPERRWWQCWCCAPSADAGKAAGSDPTKPQPDKKPPAELPALSLQEATLRVWVAWSLYFTLLPMVLSIALKAVDLGIGLILGLSLSAFLVVLNLLLWIWKFKQEPPYILDGALLIYYAVVFGIYAGNQAWQEGIFTYFNISLHGWVTLVMVLTQSFRFPWALQNAREAAPSVAWSSPTFMSVVDQVSAAWAFSQALTTGLCAIPVSMGQSGKDPLNIVFNYAWPLACLAIMLALTRCWPSFMRARYYLPRLHQGTVKPVGDVEQGQAEKKDGQEAQPAAPLPWWNPLGWFRWCFSWCSCGWCSCCGCCQPEVDEQALKQQGDQQQQGGQQQGQQQQGQQQQGQPQQPGQQPQGQQPQGQVPPDQQQQQQQQFQQGPYPPFQQQYPGQQPQGMSVASSLAGPLQSGSSAPQYPGYPPPPNPSGAPAPSPGQSAAFGPAMQPYPSPSPMQSSAFGPGMQPYPQPSPSPMQSSAFGPGMQPYPPMQPPQPASWQQR